MLLESLVKATMELQGFRVMAVTGDAGGLVAELVPDLRFSPRCGQCGAPGRYRDTRGTRRFRHVPLWGIAVALRYAPRRVRCARCAGVHVESLPWVSGKQQMTPRAHGGARDVGPGPCPGSRSRGCSVLVGHRGDGGRGGGRLWPGAAGALSK